MLSVTEKDAIDEIVPGLVDVYERLIASSGNGIRTSDDIHYSKTFFGRDGAVSAKLICEFDQTTAKQTIRALAALQGVIYNSVNGEQPGKIHHELRDLHGQTGRLIENIAIRIYAKLWGAKKGILRTYFATDATANYIRLIAAYHTHDTTILDEVVTTQTGETTVAETVVWAADWIVSQLDKAGRHMTYRTGQGLPCQTFQDSVSSYAWADGYALNYRRPHSFVEVQAYGADALMLASTLLTHKSAKVRTYRKQADRMREALFRDYWNSKDSFFTSLLSERNGSLQQLDVPNISVGWTLDTGLWDDVPELVRAEKIGGIVRRLFSEEFLTDVGLRTHSKYFPSPLGGMVDYHGAQTVWPMFTFMVIEGLRRQQLHTLADELETRLINGTNALRQLTEFFIVDERGHVLTPTDDITREYMHIQMMPERDIAFTIVPMVYMVRTIHAPRPKPTKQWIAKLEEEILHTISPATLFPPTEAATRMRPKKIYATQSHTFWRSLFYIYGRIAP